MTVEKLLNLAFSLLLFWFGTRSSFLIKGYGVILHGKSNQELVLPKKATPWNKLILLMITSFSLLFAILIFFVGFLKVLG